MWGVERTVTLQRIAMLSVHTSPLATPGGKKVGGMNVYVRELSLELARRGVKVDIFTRRTDAADEAVVEEAFGHPNVRVVNITAGPVGPLGPEAIYPYLQEFTARVIALSTREGSRYDMVYSHYWLSGWVANKLKEVWGTPFVQMFHTLGHMKNRIPSVMMPVPSVRITLETQVVEWADMLVAGTPAEQAQLLWLYRADRRKIIVVPPGVDPQRFRPISRDAAREQLGLPKDRDLLLFVGRIEPLKAVDSIIEALSLLKAEQPKLLKNTHFAIIGGDPTDPTDTDMAALRTMTVEMGLEDYVDFLGAKDQSALAVYYAAATAVIMPSEYESFGMVALEAMASGTPVIASEVGGLAYLVRDEKTGFLVPARDPQRLAKGIANMLTNPLQRETMGIQAADLARKYAWSAIADRLLPHFERLAACGQIAHV